MKKKTERYNLKQIIQVVKDIYSQDSSLDSWNCPVIYEPIFLSALKKRLKHIKDFIK